MFPHASVAVHVRVCVREHPEIVIPVVIGFAVTGPQLSVTVADPNAESIAVTVGLQPRAKVVPVAVITGANESLVQVTVLETDNALFPQASVAVQLLVCDREHPVTVTPLVAAVGVIGPQASVTVARPNAESIAVADGLQPSVNVVPVATITGTTESTR